MARTSVGSGGRRGGGNFEKAEGKCAKNAAAPRALHEDPDPGQSTELSLSRSCALSACDFPCQSQGCSFPTVVVVILTQYQDCGEQRQERRGCGTVTRSRRVLQTGATKVRVLCK